MTSDGSARGPGWTQQGLTGVLDALSAISEGLDLPTKLHRIVRAAADVVDAEYGALGVLDGRGGLAEFVYVGVDEATVAQIGPLPVGHGLVGLLIDHPQVMRLADLTAHPAAVGFPPGHPVMRTFIGAPILVGDTVFGNLYLTEKRNGAEFTERDELVLRALASAAGSAVQNARLFGELRRRERWLLATAEIRAALLSGGTIAEALTLIAARATDLTAADGALVLLADDHGGLRVAATAGSAAPATAGPPAPATADSVAGADTGGATGSGPDRYAAARGAAASGADDWTRAVLGAAGPRDAAALPTPADPHLARVLAGAAALLIAPLPAGATAGGIVICLRATGSERFTDDQTPQLTGLAEQASLALEVSDRAEQRRRLALVTERERIARDLHDHVVQRLFAVGLSLQGQGARASDARLRERLEQAVQQVDEAIRDLRSSIFDLRSVDGEGRKNLRRRLLDIAAEADAAAPAVAVRIDGAIDTLVPPALAGHVEAVAREAVSNAVRHAGAGTVTVTVTAGHDLVVEVVDDGRGIPPAAPRSGLANLAERAENCGGALTVTAGSTGGTTVRWAVPLPAD